MTKKQFDNLAFGDIVILPWSETPRHVVTDIYGNGMICTKYANEQGEASTMSATYCNIFTDIQLPVSETNTEDSVVVPRSILQRVYNIAKKATRIVEDWSWGDVYPEESEEFIFPKDLVDALGEALEK